MRVTSPMEASVSRRGNTMPTFPHYKVPMCALTFLDSPTFPMRMLKRDEDPFRLQR